MNDMSESADIVEQAFASSMKRRDFLTKAAAASAIAWSAPVILSRPAHAVDGIGGTPGCQPSISVECVTHWCQQGNKCFPGIKVVIGPCDCSTGTPVACIRITNLTPAFRAYGDSTNCNPSGASGTECLSTGMWECIDSPETVFFGHPRSGGGSNPPPCGGNGAINEIGDGSVITFRMAIWAGGCTDTTGDPAFVCKTYNVSMVWQQNALNPGNIQCPKGHADPCIIAEEADPLLSLCTHTPPHEKPCCPPHRQGPPGPCCS